MEEATRAAILKNIGRIGVLELAIKTLIDRSPRPDEIRLEIAESVAGLARVLDGTGDLDQAVIALGLREGAEELTTG